MHLKLAGFSVDAAGVRALAEGLKENQSLLHLDLTANFRESH